MTVNLLAPSLAEPHVDAKWPDAVALAHRIPTPLTPERLPVPAAIGRVLAADVRARTPLPSFTASAMDGWAVAGAGPWHVVGSVALGTGHPAPLDDGTAIRVHTGSPIPSGASAVLRLERGRETDGALVATDPPAARGSDIRPQGEELESGAIVARTGAAVTPPLAGLVAAVGLDHVLVRRAPRVSLLVLGDELLTHGPPHGSRIRDALGVQLPGWVSALGGRAEPPVYVADQLVDTCAAIADARADVVVTTGGSSVGQHDHVREAVARVGGSMIVDQVAVRPGHPMLLAALPVGRYLVGLPGNPGAAVAGVLTLLRPLIAGLLGRAEVNRSHRCVLAGLAGGRVHRLEPAIEVAGQVAVVRARGPAMLTGWAAASCAVVIPPAGVQAGEPVEVLSLPW